MFHYLDNAATTSVRPEAIRAAVEAMETGWGNPSSRYALGQQAAGAVKGWRETVAKALGNGMPVGAFLACGPAATAMVPGDHGTTYGGNPLVTAAAAKVLDLFAERKIVEHVREIGGYLWDTLEKLAAECPLVKDHRGVGLIQGLEFTVPVGPVVQEALLEQKLILISAGANVIRFVPPLIVTEADIDHMAEKLEQVLPE